ncbi:MAG: ABC-2 family transporter protein, partial [Oscillospiraceae bacterium]|nr:ABC-2 family transporter protein [Oscillospiraceae bacterium]
MKLYLKFLSIHFRSAMTYRASFFLSCLGHLLITTNVFLGVLFLLERFDSIGGYTLPQLSLCYSVILAATSLAECFGRGFDAFTRILAQAQFDRIMLRPRSLFFQVICQDMKPTMLARVLQAAVMLVWGIAAGAVVWTPIKALVLALMILCGAAIFFGLFLVNACICFFTLEHIETLNIFLDGPREYG